MDSINNKTENTINKLWTAIFLIFVILIAGIIILFSFLYTNQVMAVFDNSKVDTSRITATEWNNLGNEIGGISGMIAAFNDTVCPIGWSLADGSSGSPDLRGVFVRGLNDFGTGVRNDGDEDPDGAGRTAGNLQNEQIDDHLHTLPNFSGGQHPSSGSYISGATGSHYNDPTSYRGGAETRPKNVALIHCIKN